MALAQIDSLALKMTMSQIKMYNDIHEQYHVIHNAILNNYYAGSVAQVIDSNESMDHIYAVADASESCVNMLPLPPKDPNV